MRAVPCQRVISARVRVGERVVGEIDRGLLVLLGVGAGRHRERTCATWPARFGDMRVFESDAGKPMDRSVADVGGACSSSRSSRSTATCAKGRRPSFDDAAPPDGAGSSTKPRERIALAPVAVATGEFQAMMQVELVNDGPVTVLVDSRRQF